MIININNKEINLKYSFRGYMIFEQIANHAFSGNGMSDFILLFYSMMMGSDKELTITFDEFVEWLDMNPEKLQEFSKWITDNITKQNELTNKKDTDTDKELDPKN